ASVDEQGTVLGTPLSADPLLGTLQNNGGPTQTMVPSATSPAIDAGDPDCTDPAGAPIATDQRGVLRPGGTACDIGAVELARVHPVTGQATAVGTTTATLGGTVTNPDSSAGIGEFQFGTTLAYRATTTAQTVPAATAGAPLSAAISGLLPGTTYH